MQLVPQVDGRGLTAEFMEALGLAVDADNDQWWYWAMYTDNKPCALAEAYLLWKDGGE